MPHPARIVSVLMVALAPGLASAQATLNKCIDAEGLVTYTNKSCVNAREVRKLEIDPSPIAEAPRGEPAPPARVPPPAPKNAATDTGTIQLETRKAPSLPATHKASAGQCETLAEQLGRVLDKMDQARRKGYTQAQMDKWNEESRALERKKQQSACF